MPNRFRCLLIYPEFTLASFWNFRAACELRGAKYPAMPLGLVTVAAMLPREWDLRLVDCNVERLTDADLEWAEIVFVGGMLAQQPSLLKLIARAKQHGKRVVVGGPDATSSPHIYDHADHLVLGEAEVTLPRWLDDFQRGSPEHRYDQGEKRADVSTSPTPRYDLLTFNRYLYAAVQFGRGCPFLCEFCDIIELFGRVPRLKTPEQLLAELDRLYALGHRGHVDFVDDNFVGNKRDVKKFLPHLIAWQESHNWPFEFSTEASINLADDEELLQLMQRAGFFTIFCGIESPDDETLKQMQKKQNTNRSLSESMHRIYAHGIGISTGYIVGFDNERGSVADGILGLIDSGATPVNMVGLLFALPGTQLTRRLAKEGRLVDNFDRVSEEFEAGDQCSYGINFQPLRPRGDMFRDLRRIISESYSPKRYFDRVARMALMLNCSQKKVNKGLKHTLVDLLAAARMVWRQGVLASYRVEFWRTIYRILRGNPAALWYSGGIMSLYLHFDPFSKFALGKLDESIAYENNRVATEREAYERREAHEAAAS
jgi:hypothetical protein